MFESLGARLGLLDRALGASFLARQNIRQILSLFLLHSVLLFLLLLGFHFGVGLFLGLFAFFLLPFLFRRVT